MHLSFQAAIQVLRSVYKDCIIELENGITDENTVFITVKDRDKRQKGFMLYDFKEFRACGIPPEWLKLFEDAYFASIDNYERVDKDDIVSLANQEMLDRHAEALFVEQEENWSPTSSLI